MVVFGGLVNPTTRFSETWEYYAAWDVVGRGHLLGSIPLTCSSPPRIGTTFCVNQPPQGFSYNLLLVKSGPPVHPVVVLEPPGVCTTAFVHVLPEVVLTTAVDPPLYCVALPPEPGMIGFSLTLQGASIRAGGCFRATDAVTVVVQP
jgi:hypothetical protein